MIFHFFDPGDFGPRGRHRPDPDVKIWRSKGLNPSYYVVFYGDFDVNHLESHNSKQMMVYEQITFFIKNRFFFKICFWIENRFFDWKIDLWIKKTWKNIEKPRIPIKTKGFLLKPEDSY